jgi:hypothetical protein
VNPKKIHDFVPPALTLKIQSAAVGAHPFRGDGLYLYRGKPVWFNATYNLYVHSYIRIVPFCLHTLPTTGCVEERSDSQRSDSYGFT